MERAQNETPGRLLSGEAVQAFLPDAKIALVATRTDAGLPHVTLLTSLTAKDPAHLMFGQFTEGWSKDHLARDPRCGFVVLTADRRLWWGRARWTGRTTEGEDVAAYNRRPMFRYSAYTNIHTVHYLDLEGVDGEGRLSTGTVLSGLARTALAAVPGVRPGRRGGEVPALKAWARRHLGRPTTLCFPAWIDADGHPVVVPPTACRPLDAGRLVLPVEPWMRRVPAEAPVALFAVDPDTRSVLVRGRLSVRRTAVGRVGVLDLDWVYNSMPPVHGPVFPEAPLEPVTAFEA